MAWRCGGNSGDHGRHWRIIATTLAAAWCLAAAPLRAATPPMPGMPDTFAMPARQGLPLAGWPGLAVHENALCGPAIADATRGWRIPAGLLAAIAEVESGRRRPDGSFGPWPWTINAEGQGRFFATKAEAISAVRGLQARGVRSIDVGCLQVNLLHHPDAFATLDQAFDPVANAQYAARFLTSLRDQTGNWQAAAAAYHSTTPALGQAYQRQVWAAWQRGPDAALPEIESEGPASAPDSTGPGPFMLSQSMAPRGRDGAPTNTPSAGRSLAAYRRAPVQLANAAPLLVLRMPVRNRH